MAVRCTTARAALLAMTWSTVLQPVRLTLTFPWIPGSSRPVRSTELPRAPSANNDLLSAALQHALPLTVALPLARLLNHLRLTAQIQTRCHRQQVYAKSSTMSGNSNSISLRDFLLSLFTFIAVYPVRISCRNSNQRVCPARKRTGKSAIRARRNLTAWPPQRFEGHFEFDLHATSRDRR